ncbi:MAG: hypothetical protein AB2A00_01175 [Myxococcota bacterium]
MASSSSLSRNRGLVLLRALLVPGALILGGCPQLALFMPVTRAGNGEVCEGAYDCQDGLDCICQRCAPVGTVGSCDDLGDAGVPVCGDTRPVCFAECGSLVSVSSASCNRQEGRWQCTTGVLFSECPDGTCWGPPRTGEVCVNGSWECPNGETNLGECYTPGGCNVDGGVTIAPGCRYTPTCNGSVSACQSIWCRDGTDSPAVCVANRWACDDGVLTSTCPPDCGEGPVPDCFASCGDPRVVGSAACTEGGYVCTVGVLRNSCPSNTCWTPPPAGAAGCVDGGWVCGDAGNAPGGGCNTPNGCGDAGEPPFCYAEVCCNSQPLPALCVDYQWSCANLTSSTECLARPICNFHLDAGVRDAARADVGVPDAAAPDAALDAGVPDVGVPEAGTPEAGVPDAAVDGGVSDAAVPGDAAVASDAAVDAGPTTDAGSPDGGAACTDDLYEPNDSRAEAPLLFPPVVLGSLPGNGLTVCVGQEDWFLFNLNGGEDISATLQYVGGNVRVILVDPDDLPAAVANPVPDGQGGGTTTLAPFEAPVSGTYAIRVVSVAGAQAAEYTLSVDVQP